jgi:hypothetical protein
LNELRKISDKMTFRGGIALPEPTHVGLVKREKFQHFPRSAGKYSRDPGSVAMYRRSKMKH